MRARHPLAPAPRALAAAAALTCAAATGAHASSLTCRVLPKAPLLGQPVSWTVAARGLPPLPSVSAAGLGADWLLQGQTSEGGSGPGGTTTQTLSLTLYPLRAGTLTLPAMAAGTRRCPARALRVADHAPGQPAQTIAAHVEPAQAMVGQPLRLVLDIGTSTVPSWQDVEVRASGALLGPPSLTTARIDGPDGASIPVQRETWPLTPLHDGALDIAFGPLRATPLGQLVVFPGPTLRLAVRPLPAFWPPDAPVGHARLVADPAPAALPLRASGELRATLSGAQVGRDALLRSVGATAAPDGMRLYAARVVAVDGGADQAAPSWRITLPYRVLRGGVVAYPTLAVPYFDPVRGAPGLATAQWGRVTVHDPRPMRLAAAVGLTGGLVLALALARLAARRLRAALCRARWARIARRGDTDRLLALWQAAIARGAPDAVTLRSWVASRRCGRRPLGLDALDRLVDAIERDRYGPHR